MLKTFEIAALVASIVLLLSLAGLGYLSSPPSGHPSHQQTAAQAEHKEQREEQHSLRGFFRYLFPDGIAVFTFWLVVATILLGVVAVVQIGFLERAENIATQTAQAAKDSADATKKAVELSERTAERQLRAYVFIEKANVFLQGRAFVADMILKNSGQTPAYDLFTITRMFSGPATQPFTGKLLDETAEINKGNIGPGLTIRVRGDLTIPINDQLTIPHSLDGRAVIYIVGRIQYRTAFGKVCKLDFKMRSVTYEGDRWIMGNTPDGEQEHCE